MSAYTPRTIGYVCKTCKTRILTKPAHQLSSLLPPTTTNRAGGLRSYVQIRAASSHVPQNVKRSVRSSTSSLRPSQEQNATTKQLPSVQLSKASTTPKNILIQSFSDEIRRLRNQIHAIAASEIIPERDETLKILDQAQQCANLLVFGNANSPEAAATGIRDSSENVSLLSDLDENDSFTESSKHRQNAKETGVTPSGINLPQTNREKGAAELCEILYSLLKEPKVAMDEKVLSMYVRIICQLGHPEYLPEIFFLYANKPVPCSGTKPVQYTTISPSAAKNAIPQSLSDIALDTAILQRDLPLAIAIIDTTVATRAFRRNKFLRKGSIPLAAVGSTPLVAWAGAEWVAQWQDTFDPAMSKAMTMMGAMAYIGTLGTVGFIALTTWNDHHDRVVWTPGTPLRQRWSREEERLYFDRIAVAWGFQRRQRRGEEMGEEWEALREILGERSMILDKSDLLEGMQ